MCGLVSDAQPVDRPWDDDWDWGATYTTQLCHSVSSFGSIPHLKVRRHDGRDGITWDVLQRIKNDVVGPDELAIEIFPPADQVVNDANIRHLWIVPRDLLPFGLHHRKTRRRHTNRRRIPMNKDRGPGFQLKDWQAVIVAILLSSLLSMAVTVAGGFWEHILAVVGAYHIVVFVLNVTASAAAHVRSRGLAVLRTRATYHLCGTIRQERRAQFATLLSYAEAVVHNRTNVPDTLRTAALAALPADTTLDQLPVYELANIVHLERGDLKIWQVEARYQNPALVAKLLASFAEQDLFYQVLYRGRVLEWTIDQEHRLDLVERPVERVPVGSIGLELRLSYIAWDIQWLKQYVNDDGSTHVLAFIWFKVTWSRFVVPVADVLKREAEQLRAKETHQDFPDLPLRRVSITVYPGLVQPSNDLSKQTLKLRRGSRLAVLHRRRWRNSTIDYVRANH